VQIPRENYAFEQDEFAGVTAARQLVLHPDKKSVGQIERGFDFLAWRFSRQPWRLPAITGARCKPRYTGFISSRKEFPSSKPPGSVIVLSVGWVAGLLGWCRAGIFGATARG
jgi:hypothetical protein